MKLAFALAALPVFLCSIAAAQARSPQQVSAVAAPSTLMEVECEGDPCDLRSERKGTWLFHGILGDAEWSNGDVAKLVVERFDAGGVDIRRIDLPNSSSYGLTAVYTGVLNGNRIEGSVVWSWNGHWNDEHPSGKWSATVQAVSPVPPVAEPLNIPSSLFECEANQCAPGHEGGCTWVFHGTEGEAHCHNGAHAMLEIKQFDSNGIVICRTDPEDSISHGLTAIYTGTLRGKEVTGFGAWSWPGHWNNHRPSGRWFATVEDVTGSSLPPFPPRLVSPEVHQDGSVTFRDFNPNSLEVFLDLEGSKPVIMQKDDLGVWSITTEPLQPDYYGYIFRDADVPLLDPSNPLILPNLLQTENMVHVPGPASLPWESDDEPHGVVHHHTYTSRVIGDQEDFYVYTPPGYDARAASEYPVLYLLHGYGQESKCWTEVAFANRILDHLIDEGKARPMIVVMPNGYGGPELIANGTKLYWNDSLREKNFNKFTESLLTEVIPQVERDYRVNRDRNARAIAGLSMGGAESLLTGLNHLEEFSWIGAFSSGGLRKDIDQDFPGLGAAANSKMHLLWVACGTDDPAIGRNRDFRRWLDSKGITHVNIETPGQHTWMVWRRNLVSFAPLLFR